MNAEIANSLFGYFEMLYRLNQKLIILCGTDVIDDFENDESHILDIIQNIPKLIPYSYNNKTEKLEFKNNDGLLEYNKQINYLSDNYNKILKDNYDFLESIRKVRNKYQHKMHGVKLKSSGSGSLSLFNYTFKVGEEEISLYAGAFIKLIKMVNELFTKLVFDVRKYAYENSKDDYIYYRRITRFEFTDFNIIYDSDLLRTVGKLSKKF